MKLKKRLFASVLAGVMLMTAGLTGCGGSDGGSGGGGDSGKKELELWTWKIAMTPGFEAAAEKFEEDTGVSIKVQAFSPDETYKQKVTAAANSGDLPDLIHWWASRGIGFENVLVNLTDKITDDYKAKFSSTAFNGSIVTENDVKNWANDPEKSDVVKSLNVGDCYHIPLDVGGFFTIFANTDILEEAGVSTEAPKTYEEFIENCAQVAENTDYGGFVFGGGLPDVYYNWMGRAIEAMYLGVDKSAGLVNRTEKMSDPENIKPLKMFEELVKSGGILDGTVSKTIDDGDQSFAAGEAAYLLGGTFTYGQLSAMGMDVSKVTSFIVPAMEGSVAAEGFAVNPDPLTAMAISKDSEYQDEAYQFIQYITEDPEGISTFANGAYVVPAAKLTDETLGMLDPALQDMYSAMSDEPNVCWQVDNWEGTIGRKAEWTEFYNDMQKIITGELTAEEVAANFDKNAEAQAASGN